MLGVVLAAALGSALAVAGPVSARTSGAGLKAPTYTYVVMPDGVQLAVVVSYPRGFAAHRRWPVLFMMDGYDGGGGPLDPAAYDDHYVMVHASLRGTGCSDGRFDLFSRRTALDGKFLVDRWIPQHAWSDGRVGIIGHSYPGLTGFAVAETAPRHLRAVAVSGLVDDLYRGLSYPGGVPNGGFTVLWPALLRPAQEYDGNYSRYEHDEPGCLATVAHRGPPVATDDPIVNGAAGRMDDRWWAAHSLITDIAGIRAPMHIVQQYQDEQTGPRGGSVLWQRLPSRVPKRLVLTNGVHATHDVAWAHRDEVRWLDCWILRAGHGCGHGITARSQRVQVLFDTTGSGNDPQYDATNRPYVAADFPAPQTRWRRLYLHGSGVLSPRRPRRVEGSRSYVALPFGRQAYLSGAGVADASSSTFEVALDDGFRDDYGPLVEADGPDQLTYRLPVHRATVVLGPIEADLWLTSTAPDTDVFVQLVDEAPNGSRSYLQRGMLRASLRSTVARRDDRVRTGPLAGASYRPYHPFTRMSLLTPGQPVHLQIEVFPVGFVLPAGHQLLVQVYAPPAMDEFAAYGSAQPLAVNTILSSPAHPSSVLVPFLPSLPPLGRTHPSCGTVTGVRCTAPLR